MVLPGVYQEVWARLRKSREQTGGGLYAITFSSTTVCLKHHSDNKYKFMQVDRFFIIIKLTWLMLLT